MNVINHDSRKRKIEDKSNEKYKTLKLYCETCNSNLHDTKDCKMNLLCKSCNMNGHIKMNCPKYKHNSLVVNPLFDHVN